MQVKSVTLLGHKDHGKSTLIGSLLMQTGAATKVRIKEAEEYSKRLGKTFEPAFILDSFAEERTGEMTIDTTRAEIKYKDLAFALIDVPGHEELIKNMISGASYGEVALLLVSAKRDEGIKDQTKRHLFLSRMFGIEDLVVAVNKMDTRDFDEDAFLAVKKELSGFIERIGFDQKRVSFVPISAYSGENLVKKSSKMKWYNGEPLIDAIYESAKKEKRQRHGALRLIVQGMIDADEGIIGGKIVNGDMKIGERIAILPQDQHATVKDIVVKGNKVKIATTGENVAIRLDKKVDFEVRGSVISNAEEKPRLTDKLKAKIFIVSKPGKTLRIKFNGIDLECGGMKILNSINTVNGKKGPAKMEVLNAVEAEIQLDKKLPVEEFETTKELGRFVLYSGKEFMGIGTIIS
ncbi:MAG: GTP-binding protein [Candidatus Micrarchaeales archaeon]|nr:GTP-binding protein [Candidatus Micrarchaeales archaeon]